MATRLTTWIVAAIVTATFIAGLIVGAQRDEANGPVDLIIYNGKVYTGVENRFVEAVAVRGNQILKVGSNREIKRLRRAQTTVIDAHGGAVVAGFNDAHIHFLSGGLALDELKLLDAVTLDQIKDAVRAFAEAHPDLAWIRGRGWHDAAFPGGLPTRQVLDDLVPDRPAFLVGAAGHMAWANSKALARARITRRTPNPKGGAILKDPRTGEPTGVLKGSAQELIAKLLPPPTRDEKIAALKAATLEAHRLGITSVQNASGGVEEFELYDELRRAGELRVRVYAALSAGPGFAEADADRLDAIWRKHPDDPLFKTGAVELRAERSFDESELARLVALLDRRGWQVMIHASSGDAVRMALDAYEHAIAANPAPARERRHRLEHVGIIDAADLARADRLGVVTALQPVQAPAELNELTASTAELGDDRADRGWVWRSLQAGGRLAFGSDWPAATLDPRAGMHAAADSTAHDGTPEGGPAPEERLPLSAVVDAYTSGGAYASFDEQRKGTLARGMLADLVILSADIFAGSPEGLLDANVEMTIFDGKVVYARGAATATEP